MKTLRTVLLTLAVCLICAATAFCDVITHPRGEYTTFAIVALLILACVVVTIVLIARTKKRK